ncbi:MAG: PssD/Cps14F family polysaccharide biosynthesis glycosyltransferase [Candidatus Omnitrophota bacterium]
MKIGIIVSGGGHLDEAMAIIEAFKGHDIFLVTYTLDSLALYTHPEIKKVYFVTLKKSNGIGLFYSLFINIFEFLSIFLKERPKILFSTGSEIAIIPFFVGKFLFRTKLIFLETFTRVKNLSSTAKIIYSISDLFLVQWKDLLKIGKRARFEGRVI